MSFEQLEHGTNPVGTDRVPSEHSVPSECALTITVSLTSRWRMMRDICLRESRMYFWNIDKLKKELAAGPYSDP
ncbi:MAG: hypothetical protein H0W86_10930 [Armatimonadetes bacterium]|nr:hypothetical protein [Armatimonadota bacterium]